MLRLIRACIGGRMKFNTVKWNNYELKLFPYKKDLRSIPFFSWIPFFWDSDVAFDLGIRTPKTFSRINEDCNYHWELRDLDGHVVTRDNRPIQGDDVVLITNNGFRRKFIDWNSGKVRAVVLGNLHPHREYILCMKFRTSISESNTYQMASLTIDDRSTWQMQMFLILFSIVASLFFAGLFKSCGM